jgi:hypothetical protein
MKASTLSALFLLAGQAHAAELVLTKSRTDANTGLPNTHEVKRLPITGAAYKPLNRVNNRVLRLKVQGYFNDVYVVSENVHISREDLSLSCLKVALEEGRLESIQVPKKQLQVLSTSNGLLGLYRDMIRIDGNYINLNDLRVTFKGRPPLDLEADGLNYSQWICDELAAVRALENMPAGEAESSATSEAAH